MARSAAADDNAGETLTLAQVVAMSPYKCRRTVDRAVKAGKLIARQPNGKGSRLLFALADVRAWLDRPAEVAAPPAEKPKRRRRRCSNAGMAEAKRYGLA